MSGQMYSLNVYETPTHFYIIGSDPSETRFRTLKIDRVTDRNFIAGEPDNDYTRADIGELLATVSSSSIVTPTEKWAKRRNCAGGSGLLRTVEKAWGLIGAVRFLEGYYLLLVSRARTVASIGFHSIMKVEDVSMIYIPAMGAPSHPDELKYAKLFQSVDFTADFYFSHTYQLSKTLQENFLAEKGLKWNRNHYRPEMRAEGKFVWNDYLLGPLHRNGISRKWTIELVRGYIAHQLIELPCAKLDLVLLARRSAAFAGTRFLKRGTNCDGSVANDVETEQIVWDSSSSMSFQSGKFSSFVQRRGSVPLFWSQDSIYRGAPMVVGKPPIRVDLVEPQALTTAKHFRDLGRKYGHPLIVLNLVKREEHRHNENLLHDIFLKTVRYLNEFRRTGHCIDYISFDVSRCNKTGRVLQRLEELGQRVTMSTGWFQSFPQLRSRSPSLLLTQQTNAVPPGTEESVGRYCAEMSSDGRMLLQHGIVRSNCVDCLDRTNVVQFGIGKIAMGWQLYSMGFLCSPWALHLHTEVCRVFEEMFDEHGDTLAWQYAGSQLVHSIKTYKRTAVFQERSRDVLQTISRYYSNTFGDYEKQDGLNLFLGIFRAPSNPSDPSSISQHHHIWALGSDHYLHFPISRYQQQKSNEFLEWSISVNSDGEEEEEEEGSWLEGKGELEGWLMLKAAESELKLDSNFVELNPELHKLGDGGEPGDLNFDLAHRTFELSSLDQLLRSHQQQQLRRPLMLESLDQSTLQKDSFMRMFRGSDHSPSPPPGTAPRRRESASSTFSSLAAGTASIMRECGTKVEENVGKVEENVGEAEVEGEGDEETDGLTANMGADEGEEPPEEEGTELTVLSMDEEKRRRESNVSATQEAAALAVAATEGTDDLLVMEDRNWPETDRDPLARFLALLNGPPRWRSDSTSPKQQLNLGTNLKSPQEVYFSGPPADEKGSPLFSISDADMALYTQYASASASVFERHNLRRQRKPTVWKLPAPPSRTKHKIPPSAESDPPAFRSSLLKKGKEQQQPKKSLSSMQRILPSIGRSATQSPFRKDFSKLGPMFQFRPSHFTNDSAFETELPPVSEESLRLYREVAELKKRERKADLDMIESRDGVIVDQN